jgi:hypothetical protein
MAAPNAKVHIQQHTHTHIDTHLAREIDRLLHKALFSLSLPFSISGFDNGVKAKLSVRNVQWFAAIDEKKKCRKRKRVTLREKDSHHRMRGAA